MCVRLCACAWCVNNDDSLAVVTMCRAARRVRGPCCRHIHTNTRSYIYDTQHYTIRYVATTQARRQKRRRSKNTRLSPTIRDHCDATAVRPALINPTTPLERAPSARRHIFARQRQIASAVCNAINWAIQFRLIREAIAANWRISYPAAVGSRPVSGSAYDAFVSERSNVCVVVALRQWD